MVKFYFVPRKFIVSFLLLSFFAFSASAQLVGWSERQPVKITENSNTLLTNYQVLVEVNTQALIAAGKLQGLGQDLRFSKNCDGSILFEYFIESGINTPNTKIWVMVDNIPANSDVYMYMFYGNNTAPAASSFDNTFPPATRLEVPSPSTIALTGVNNYSWVDVQAGATINITAGATLEINARKIKISGAINGNGAGNVGGPSDVTDGSGPGGGGSANIPLQFSNARGGGGGGYGGIGGDGANGAGTYGLGGINYGTSSLLDFEMGSGGGGSVIGPGGSGGGALKLRGNVIEVTGTISVNGNDGVEDVADVGNGGSGAGSGGSILIQAKELNYNTGILNSNGGSGGIVASNKGGNGAGGRIKVFYENLISAGTTSVLQGSGGLGGSAGTSFSGILASTEPSSVILPVMSTNGLSSSDADNTICLGTSVAFTASAGFASYDFTVNAVSVQSGASNTYSSATLADNDIVRVLVSPIPGCTDSSNKIVMQVDNPPSVSDAGLNQIFCELTATTLAANNPLVGSGNWTIVSGAGVFTDATLNNTDVTALPYGNNVFKWTITNGVCPSSESDVTIIRNETPTVSDAGLPQQLCENTTTTLNANTPTVGTGAWTVVAGTATVDFPASPNSSVSNLNYNTNTFRWTISNASCPPSQSDVTITRYETPTSASAGLDQQYCETDNSAFTANTPLVGTGTWSLIGGSGTISNASDPLSTVTALGYGTNTFRWTISSGNCPASSDDIIISRYETPTTANAGADQVFCETDNSSFAGNTPVVGTGSWSLISGTGTITISTDPTSIVTALGYGNNIFRWTISNGTCATSIDEVTIKRDQSPSTADAGSDDAFCENTTATLNANNPIIGSGSWSIISGSVVFNDPSLFNTGINSIAYGVNTLRWTIDNASSCPASTNDVSISRYESPSTSNAGTAQSLCENDFSNLAAIIPTVGSAAWTVITPGPVVSNNTDPNSAVSGLNYGINTFRWTVSNGNCPVSFSDIDITRNQSPTVSNAGSNQSICSASAVLSANTPTTGSGSWSVISGGSTVTDPLDPNSGVTGLTYGANTFRWSISNGSCPVSTSDVTVTRDEPPTASVAGADFNNCSDVSTLAGNNPAVGTGAWTVVSGTGIIGNPALYNSSLSNLSMGANTFGWTISNGTCPSSYSEVTVTRDTPPTVSNAGSNQSICSASAVLSANTPTTGSGSWSVISGGSTVTDPLDPNSGVTGLTYGANTFRWSISNGSCPVSTSDVTVTRDEPPTTSAAGADFNNCSDVSTLAGNNPAVGTGAWTVVSGTGIIGNPALYNSSLSNLSMGANTFGWTISNGTCPSSYSEVTVTRDTPPTVSNAGSNQSICSASAVLSANTPTTGSGSWSVISGGSTVTDPLDPNSGVTGLTYGANTFRWSISNGSCPVSTSDVTVTRDEPPTASVAGADFNNCSDVSTLAGNNPAVGTGAWTVVSGTGIIGNPALYNSSLSNLSMGANTFGWTISNGTCPSSYSEVTVTRDTPPTVSNAGSNQSICSASAVLSANTPTTGSGSWSVISGGSTVTDPLDPNSGVTGLTYGANTFRWSISNGSCPVSTSDVTITRDEFPSAANAGNDFVICIDNFNLSGNTPLVGTGSWSVVSGGAIVSNSNDPNSAVSNIGLGTNTFNWTVSNGSCPSSTDEISITRLTEISKGIISASQSICEGSTIILSVSGTTPSANIQWQDSTFAVGIWNDIPGETNNTLTISPVTDTYYRVKNTAGFCNTQYSDSVVITVKKKNLPGTISSSSSYVCTGKSVNLQLSGFLGNIQWQASEDSINWNSIAGATSSMISVSPLKDTYYRVNVSNGTCNDTLSLPVKLTSLYGAIADSAKSDQTLCAGRKALVVLTGNTGTVQWQTSATGLSGWTDLSGEITPTLYRTIDTTTFVRSVVTFGTCTDTSNTVKITTNPAANAGIISSDDSICVGSQKTILLNGSIGKIQWEKSTDNISFFNTSAADSLPVLNVNPLVSTYYRAFLTNGVCYDTSLVSMVRVDSLAIGGTAYPSQFHCIGTNSTIYYTGTYGTVNWQYSTDGITFKDTSVSSNAFVVSPNDTTYYRVKASNGVCNDAFSNIIQLSTIPGPSAGTLTAISDTICMGNEVKLTLNGSVGDLQWQSRTETGSWQNINDITYNYYTATITETRYFRVLVTTGACPVLTSNFIRIKAVDGVIAGSIASSTSGTCAGGSVRLDLNGSFGNIQWLESVSATNWAVIAGAAGDSLLTPDLYITHYYRAVLSNNYCSDTSEMFKVQVNRTAAGALIFTDKEICKEDLVKITLESHVGNVKWQSSVNNVDFRYIENEENDFVFVTPAVTTYYRAELSNEFCGAIYSVTDSVNVLNYAEAGTLYMDKIIRPGTETTLEVKDFRGDIQWQEAEDTLNFVNIIGANSDELTITPYANRYYRIKTTSGNCQDYGNIIKVTMDIEMFNISPNPADEVIIVKYNLRESEDVSLNIYSMEGKLILRKDYHAYSGYNEIGIDISSFDAGAYYLTIINNTNDIHSKFIKR